MSEEAAFLAALKANPADDTTRLVYADWLEENDEPEEAEYLQLVYTLVGLPESELLESPAADKLLELSTHVLPWWQIDAASRFELALLEFNPTDRGMLAFAIERLLERYENPPDRFQVDAMVNAAPVAVRSRLTYPAAVELQQEWQRYRDWFHSKPRMVIRPIPNPVLSECGLFDVILHQLPWDFWPKWGASYKHHVAALLGLPTREAANVVRSLPAVLFRGIRQEEVEPTLVRVRRTFNQYGCEMLPPDAVVVVPHTPAKM
jgi:uncharacterized protein (TIGR02996 family)